MSNEHDGDLGHGTQDGEHGHVGNQSPQPTHRPRLFKIEIDKKQYEISNPEPTGRDLLQLAGKVPPERFALYLRVKGQPQRIGLDEKVNLEEPGVERFVTLPLDQTEG